MIKNFKSGQSLVEVVVGIGVMSLLLVALLALVAVSVKNSRVAKDRSKAVSLAQGGVELMRAYRDFTWVGFSGAVGTSVLPAGWVVEDGLTASACDETSYMDGDNFYSRCVVLTLAGTGGVDVAVTVYWPEGSSIKQVVQTTKLSSWER